MACEVKTFGKIRDFNKVQEYFGLGQDDNWLNAINYSISPTGELIALAQGEKLAFLATCWDANNSNINTYKLSWCAELEDPNQIVTSVTCLPMQGRSTSSSVSADWTCIALGLTSGMVVFYTDNGIKLFSQCCEEDTVLSLKVHAPPRHSDAEPMVYIVYPRCVCIIKSSDIFPLLANLRHNNNRKNLTPTTPTSPAIQLADVIPFHKYKYARERETVINDAAIATTNRPCTYDHIVAQSVNYGYFAKVNAIPPKSTEVLSAGTKPYLGFYCAEEGYKLASLGEVAKDVIGQAYKNIFGNIFGRGAAETTATTDEEPPSPTKEAQMRVRCRLYDAKRDGYNITIAPGGELAAVTDNLDRVMLVHTQRACVLRVWKGYRDAQCAFVPVKERSLKGVRTHRRRALFLVIYAPRLGCLDIWALQNGPKVAAFNVCKSGQLSYSTHGLLSVQSNSSSGSSSYKTPANYCLFLDPSDASIKELQIPFHYALSETNSKTSRDIHMLRRLRNSLRSAVNETTPDLETLAQLAADFQTIELRQQCLEMLLKNRNLKPQIFHCIINAFATQLALEVVDEQHNEEHVQFKQQIDKYKRLVDFYIAMRTTSVQRQQSDYIEHLELTDSDLVCINQMVLLVNDCRAAAAAASAAAAATTREVSFAPHCEDANIFVDYLSIFDIEQLSSSDVSIPLLPDKSTRYGDISQSLFDAFLTHALCFAHFKEAALESCIPCEDLMKLALHYWLHKQFNYSNCDAVTEDMARLAAMIRAICELAGAHINDYAYNAISPWWQKIRELLLESTRSTGLLVAIVCKTVAVQLWRNNRDGSCDESSQTEDEERWERISHEETQWILLIGKLEDVAILGAILEQPILCQEPTNAQIPYDIPDCSLKSIVTGGKGIVTDLTAKWLVSTCINPNKIVEINEAVEPEITEDNKTKDENLTTPPLTAAKTINADNNEMEPVLSKLALLREHFPFSLESGPLLSLMSWQYMVHWSKNLSSLEHMRVAINCLAQFKTEDLALKHGMCCMLWNATLKFPLQNTMKLMQKVGRLPVDKMCQQDIEMSSGLVPEFLELTLEFLQHFNSSLEHEKRELKFEESLSDGPLPLQFLALQQHHAIKELLQLQYELCTVLHFIAFFQLKQHKPLSTLFDAMANKAFVADINKELNFVLPVADLVLQQQRTEFLCKVVAATMDVIREDLEQLYILDHVLYMFKICALADSWKLDKLPILRKQVTELYAYGYDAEAEVLLRDISDDEELGRVLLDIAARRLALFADAEQSRFLKIASVGQQLLQYLDNIKESNSEQTIQITATRSDEIDIGALAKLITHIYKCLSRRDTKQLHICGQMYDAVRLLQQ